MSANSRATLSEVSVSDWFGVVVALLFVLGPDERANDAHPAQHFPHDLVDAVRALLHRAEQRHCDGGDDADERSVPGGR